MLTILDTIYLNRDFLDSEKTLECGQCFRWYKQGDVYVGVIRNSILVISAETERHLTPEMTIDSLDVKVVTPDFKSPNLGVYRVDIYGEVLSEQEIRDYFDMDTDYETILETLKQMDEHMLAAVEYGKGIRILRQDPYEMLISFILSANNNIPKIKMTIEDLSQKYGKYIGELTIGDHRASYYTFPSAQVISELAEGDLVAKAIGYRAKAVYETCRRIVGEAIDLNSCRQLTYSETIEWLRGFYGVGEKVANCVALFGYYQIEAFPVDTWVKKILADFYNVTTHPEAFAKAHFKYYPGIAQQYLFHYYRNKK